MLNPLQDTAPQIHPLWPSQFTRWFWGCSFFLFRLQERKQISALSLSFNMPTDLFTLKKKGCNITSLCHCLHHEKNKTSRYKLSSDSFYHNSLQCTKMWQTLFLWQLQCSMEKESVISSTLSSIASQCRDSIKTLGYSFPQQIGWLFQFGACNFFLLVYVIFTKENRSYFSVNYLICCAQNLSTSRFPLALEE